MLLAVVSARIFWCYQFRREALDARSLEFFTNLLGSESDNALSRM